MEPQSAAELEAERLRHNYLERKPECAPSRDPDAATAAGLGYSSAAAYRGAVAMRRHAAAVRQIWSSARMGTDSAPSGT